MHSSTVFNVIDLKSLPSELVVDFVIRNHFGMLSAYLLTQKVVPDDRKTDVLLKRLREEYSAALHKAITEILARGKVVSDDLKIVAPLQLFAVVQSDAGCSIMKGAQTLLVVGSDCVDMTKLLNTLKISYD